MTSSIERCRSKKLLDVYPHQVKVIHFIHYLFGRLVENRMITEIPEFAETITIPSSN